MWVVLYNVLCMCVCRSKPIQTECVRELELAKETIL